MTNPEFVACAQQVNPDFAPESVRNFFAAFDKLEPYVRYDNYGFDSSGAVDHPDLPGISEYSLYFAEGEDHEEGLYRHDRIHLTVGDVWGDDEQAEPFTSTVVNVVGQIEQEGPDGLSDTDVLDLMSSRLVPLLSIVKEQHQARVASEQLDLQKRSQERAILAQSFDGLVGSEPTQVELPASDFLYGPEHSGLKKMFDEIGLTTAAHVQLGEKTEAVFCRPIVSGGRPYVVGFVEYDGAPVKPQLFYLSQSHAVWRWAPGMDPTNGWLEKGEDEQALTLPRVLQKTLHGILDDSNRSDRLVRITADESFDLKAAMLPVVDKYHDDAEPQIVEAHYFQKQELDPKSTVEMPDFEQRVDGWEFDSPLYGHVYADVFMSPDGATEYGFAHNQDGQAWPLYAAATTKTFRSNGLVRDTYADLKPTGINYGAYDYHSQLPNTALFSNRLSPDPSYADTFDGFLVDQPLIARYYKTIDAGHMDWADFLPADSRMSTLYYKHAGMLRKIKEESVPELFAVTMQLFEVARDVELASGSELIGHCTAVNGKMREADDEDMENATCPQRYSIKADSTSLSMFDQYLTIFDFSVTTSVPEKYDDDVVHERLLSPLYPGKQLIVSRHKAGDILDVVARPIE